MGQVAGQLEPGFIDLRLHFIGRPCRLGARLDTLQVMNRAMNFPNLIFPESRSLKLAIDIAGHDKRIRERFQELALNAITGPNRLAARVAGVALCERLEILLRWISVCHGDCLSLFLRGVSVDCKNLISIEFIASLSIPIERDRARVLLRKLITVFVAHGL